MFVHDLSLQPRFDYAVVFLLSIIFTLFLPSSSLPIHASLLILFNFLLYAVQFGYVLASFLTELITLQ